jgi:hypothetical protein
MSRFAAVALGAALMLAPPALAQRSSEVGEVVVTAERRAENLQGVPVAFSGGQPHVVVFHRADNLIVDLQVECDTRDQSDRLGELRATLKNVVGAAAADGSIELGVEDEQAGVVVPFRLEALDALLNPGQRADTTQVTIIVKTKIQPNDSFDAATGRIDAFIKKIKVVGRSQAARSGDWQLTLISPRQYRPQILEAIAKDANEAAKDVGPGYGVTLNGLERPIGWSRSGPLELALYIPYSLNIAPLPGR